MLGLVASQIHAADDLTVVVERGWVAQGAAQTAEVDQMPVVPQKRVLGRLAGRWIRHSGGERGARDLATRVDEGGCGVVTAKRAQVVHRTVLPEKGAILVAAGQAVEDPLVAVEWIGNR